MPFVSTTVYWPFVFKIKIPANKIGDFCVNLLDAELVIYVDIGNH